MNGHRLRSCVQAMRGYFGAMKSVIEGIRFASRWVWPVLVGLLLVGCATQKIDWAARVGNYTFDQAVGEFGPPDKQARLQDGTLVAEWLTSHGYAFAYPAWGSYPGWCGPFAPAYINTYAPDYLLRLTFGPDGKLKASKQFAR